MASRHHNYSEAEDIQDGEMLVHALEHGMAKELL
jgi:hypothetical protein